MHNIKLSSKTATSDQSVASLLPAELLKDPEVEEVFTAETGHDWEQWPART
jgi:hypothetical protein